MVDKQDAPEDFKQFTRDVGQAGAQNISDMVDAGMVLLDAAAWAFGQARSMPRPTHLNPDFGADVLRMFGRINDLAHDGAQYFVSEDFDYRKRSDPYVDALGICVRMLRDALSYQEDID